MAVGPMGVAVADPPFPFVPDPPEPDPDPPLPEPPLPPPEVPLPDPVPVDRGPTPVPVNVGIVTVESVLGLAVEVTMTVEFEDAVDEGPDGVVEFAAGVEVGTELVVVGFGVQFADAGRGNVPLLP